MKTSKTAVRSFPQEECGVWLDTVQLKGKVKQKRLAPPISKLLNPLVEGGGYKLAVALNFTQTKMEMPKTKQSSISAFFIPKQRVLHKLSSNETPNLDSVQLSSPTTTKPSTVSSVRKRAREISSEKMDSEESDSSLDCNLENEGVAETEAATCQKEGTSCSALLKDESLECEPPQCKRRLSEALLLPDYNETSPQPWSQDPLFTCSEYSGDLNSSESSFLDSIQYSEGFGNLIDVVGKTSTQKPAESYSNITEEKENTRLVSCKSPKKPSSLSPLGTLSKWAALKNISPQKQPRKIPVSEAHFDSLRRKPRSSPLKKRQEAEEESLATLFTQDSEGFRVIAHRVLQTRSPLKDQSNLSSGFERSSAYQPVVKEEDDEEDEMLFTQDSQGNMVIKH